MSRNKEQGYDYLVKVVIVGDSAVGKTNILMRYTNEHYKMSHLATIGVDFRVKTIRVDTTNIKMQIWDTAGQEKFRTVAGAYYKGAAGVFLVYSVTDRKTFESLRSWLQQIEETQTEPVCKVILANKDDCRPAEREVTSEEGAALAQSFGLPFLQCSAKDNHNIMEAFLAMARPIKEKLLQDKVRGRLGARLDSGAAKLAVNRKKCEC